jgi:flagellar hook-basal body complex protein FliE
VAVLPVGASGVTPFVPQTVTPSAATSASSGTSSSTSSNAFTQGLQSVQDLQSNADQLAQQVATGSIDNISDFTTAAAKASLAVSLTAALRNRAVEAYQDIMRMQV